MLNVSACPPGHKHSAPFKAITARPLQALVRHPAHGASLPLADMPTDACGIDQIDFTPPRMVGGTSEPDTREIGRASCRERANSMGQEVAVKQNQETHV